VRAGSAEWRQYLILVGLSAYLAMVFVGIAAAIAVLARERSHALGAAILLWLGMLLVYDLISLGLTVLFAGDWIRPFLLSLLLANPVDVVRMLVLLALGARASLGPGGAVLGEMIEQGGGIAVVAAALLLWLLAPLWIGWRSFQNSDAN
jgi:Cu-processing system permease protein